MLNTYKKTRYCSNFWLYASLSDNYKNNKKKAYDTLRNQVMIQIVAFIVR